MTSSARLIALYTGQPEHRWDDKPPSAIRKSAHDGPVDLGPTGLAGDAQADLSVHGGTEKALHHYPSEHYEHWRQTFDQDAAPYRPGGFGENISTEGFTEETLCIGDVLTLGTARLQISQGRQPCWKLNMHTGNPALAAHFQKTGKTGWYYRVLEPGRIEPGQVLTVIDRPCPDWNLQDVILARFNPRLDPEIAAALADLAELAAPWRDVFAKKSVPGAREDTSKRLKG